MYFSFPLGGILTKNIIFDKLDKLWKRNNKGNRKKNYKDVSIHLDLTESEETSIGNEFFFSFLIIRFYTNNENIIYISKDIQIFIEISNCFIDYLSKFNILTIFDKENITFNNMPKCDYSDDIIRQFEDMKGINSTEDIQKFVKINIGYCDQNFKLNILTIK